MKISLFRAAGLLAFGLLFGNISHAGPININPSNIDPGDSGQGTIEAWIGGLVTTYNIAVDPDLPAPGSQVFRVNTNDAAPSGYPTFGANTTSIVIPTGGYDYIALHWGGPQDGTKYQAFYIGDFTALETSFTFNAPSQHGLSWYAAFHPMSPDIPGVPDGGATIALLGVAVGLLVVARRTLV